MRKYQKLFFSGILMILLLLILINNDKVPELSSNFSKYKYLVEGRKSFNISIIHQSPNFSIFCIILTTPNNLKQKSLVVLSVWASKLCSNYRFISLIPATAKTEFNRRNLSNSSIGEPFNVMEPSNLTEEKYEKLTDKVFGAFIEIYKEFGDNYEWYLKIDDDAYVHTENMKTFLTDKDSMAPVTFGCDTLYKVEKGYPVGGPGYILSKVSFRRLGETLVKNNTFCENSGIEDIDVAR